MGMQWMLALWLLVGMSAAVLGGADASRRPRGTVAVILAALLLAGCAAVTLHGLSLSSTMPMVAALWRGALPTFSCLLGGWAAARWFVALRPAGTGSLGLLACALTIAIVPTLEGPGGALVDVVALAALLLAWGLSRRLTATGLRRLMFTAGLLLLWTGGFLLYLSIIPAQVTVESATQAASAVSPGGKLLRIAPPMLLLALLLGFFKPHRG